MPLQPEVKEFKVYEQGNYPSVLESVTLGERSQFGSKDSSAKVPCFRFVFACTDGKTTEGQLKPLLIDGDPVKFTIVTGTSYGVPRAALTKLTTQMLGRKLDPKAEAPRLDYEKLVSYEFNLLVAKETSDDGEPRNQVTGLTPITPIDVSKVLVPAKP